MNNIKKEIVIIYLIVILSISLGIGLALLSNQCIEGEVIYKTYNEAHWENDIMIIGSHTYVIPDYKDEKWIITIMSDNNRTYQIEVNKEEYDKLKIGDYWTNEVE